MGVSFRSATQSYTTSITPGSVQTGDLVLLAIIGSPTPGLPTGFTNVYLTGSLDGSGYYTRFCWRIRESGDTSYSSSNAAWIGAFAFYDFDTSQPIGDGSAWTESDASPGDPYSLALPSVTASGDAGCAAFCLAAGVYHCVFGSVTDYTQRFVGNADDTGGYTRTGLTASQSTSGPASLTSVGGMAMGVWHAIVRTPPVLNWYDHDGVKPFSSLWRAGRM